jgi:hypothetical protein
VSDRIVESRTLVEPVEVMMKPAGGGDARTETITELKVHAFKAKDLKALDGLSETDQGSLTLKFGARITRQPMQVIEELGAEDTVWLGGWVQRFLQPFLPTGETGSGT